MGAKNSAKSGAKTPIIDCFCNVHMKGIVKNPKFFEGKNDSSSGLFSFTMDIQRVTANGKTAHAFLRCLASGEKIDDLEEGQELNGNFTVSTGTYEDKNKTKHYTTDFWLDELVE